MGFSLVWVLVNIYSVGIPLSIGSPCLPSGKAYFVPRVQTRYKKKLFPKDLTKSPKLMVFGIFYYIFMCYKYR
ncbi:MAG: hypothetical protein A2508_02780 [Candidatus Lambdaproteobacteria bacterium RIFOXYD12_FULL_49_8]|uniref:Uncharacterized protein n=1 Tax=Candidatus Lambdaproteobacteria bacterium RIFOXYD2_FULL_50_16 TaxID=1817772 RepID=A0A1F6GGB7_9PROT|nr:MAG: hypothetical protein A2527_10815 [Candidatus Lambdaproteobacteria bacterium RIFOXYD2_FULL_50_16]OGG98325.1 MAG: hypothetical protein A2508_02780 [Candidatus Lambdaproteobacteria bacterium RIFOXYD12_FULL_49_8]